MVGRGSGWTLVAIALLGLVALPSAEAQIKSCGEGLTLFIRNPDIVPDAQGVFAVSGRLLLQFQVIGENADKIEAFGLSFGMAVPTGEEVCDLPPQAWVTGAYLEGYAVDQDKSDGFFIAINSNGQTSPQYKLGAAVHGYDAANNEIARFWGIIDLNHCGQQPSFGCPENPNAPDFTAPWPVLLPGDGVKAPVEGFAFEFNEKLSALIVELNGENVTGELTDWAERTTWDQDSFPDAGPGGLFLTVAPPCTQPEPVHTCGPLSGPAYKWTNRTLTNDDVVRIRATDLKGNVALKEIHIGSSTAGGTIADGLPILQMTFEQTTQTAFTGSDALFAMVLQNTGGGTAHPFAEAEVPEGWTYEWVPGHQPVPPGGSSSQQLEVHVPDNATAGEYPVKALIEYQKGQESKTLLSDLKVVVGVNSTAQQQAAEEAAEAAKDAKKSPGLGVPVLAAMVAVALALRRRS